MRILFLVLIFSAISANGQKPRGLFLEDSVLVGYPINFALIFEHNNASDLVFPDSNYNFKPFKLIKTEYFPTKTKGKLSVDSVIYTLLTFEIDSVLTISLPVISLNSKKKYYSTPSVVYLKKMVSKKDFISPKVKPSTAFYSVPLDFNSPKLFYYLILFLFSSFVLFLVFGKTIMNQFKIMMFYRKHKEFVAQFKKTAKSSRDEKSIVKGLILWKNHLEFLQNIPFSTMTTKEIILNKPIERLADALKEFDIAIYGGVVSKQMSFAFNILFEVVSDIYKSEFKKFKANLK